MLRLEHMWVRKSQMFDIKYMGAGYYQILSVQSGKSLDVANASSEPGANLWEYSWNGSNAQLWKFIVNSDGSYYIKSKLGTVVDIFKWNYRRRNKYSNVYGEWK